MAHLKMNVYVSLIIKTIDNSSIKFVSLNDDLPKFLLEESTKIDSQIAQFIKEKFDLIYDWLDIKFVEVDMLDDGLYLFYSIPVPFDFLKDNKAISYLGTQRFNQVYIDKIRKSMEVYYGS